MVTATLYIEGGGEGQALEKWFRRGWNTFFEKAGVGGCTKLVRCGGRLQAFKKFAAAVSASRANTVPILLVDSEDEVLAEHSVWRHLEARDHWQKPDNAGEDQAFLMVQFMETWFLADLEALRRYFGAGFRDSAMKKWPQLEDVPKDTVLGALRSATAQCGTSYSKGKISFKLLAEIDPARVEKDCPHAKALLQRLRALSAQGQP